MNAVPQETTKPQETRREEERDETAARIAALERENRLLREEARQGQRIRRMWEGSVAQLKRAREQLLRTQGELSEANRELEARLSELAEAKSYVERLAYSDKQVIEHMLEGVVTTDPDGRILAVNPAFERVTGYTLAEVSGHTPRILKSGRHDDAFYHGMWRHLSEEGEWQGEIWNRRKSGEVYPERLSISAIRDWQGAIVNYIGVFTDITLQKATEQELIEAREAALEASRLKSQFLANMSHEVRTPMNAIIGMADLLGETTLDVEQQRYVGVIHGAGELLLNLIDDILDLAKVEAGHLELEEISFNLAELVEDVLEVVAVRAREKQLELTGHLGAGVPEQLYGDPVRLRQILLNLIGNAVKFTETGAVRVEVEAVGAGWLDFTVHDTGIGIPEERLEAIFAAFTQSDAGVTRKYGGTGLGLTICRRLVELMGGEIRVESQPGRGSRFLFTIPGRAATPVSRHPPEELIGVPLLLAGGSDATRRITCETLRQAGARVTELAAAQACSVNQAIADGAYRAVLLDAAGLGDRCIEVVKDLRRQPGCEALPLLVMGFGERRQGLRRARELGITYLMKPVKRRDLLRAVGQALGQAGEAVREEAPHPPRPEAPIRALHILLAEDAEENALLIRAFLKDTPHELAHADNGASALKLAREEEFDLVLMDVQMPRMDGLEATRRIRALEREMGREPIPIIALTAHAMKEDERRSLEAGCDAHLTKPIRKATLLAAVNRYAVE